jgi:pimeloyl-ACP methyl ester carboxylesterase
MSKESFLYRFVGISLNTIGTLSPKLAAKVAMYLFQKPKRRPIPEKRRQFLEAAKIEIPNGVKGTAYYKWGDGDRVVLFNHGWESETSRWTTFINHYVQRGYTVIASDAPSHGLSTSKVFNLNLYAQSLAPLIKAFHPTIIVGHSAGGFVSILTGHELPEYQAEKYILLAPNNDIKDIFTTFKNLVGMRDSIYNSLLALTPEINPYRKNIDYYIAEKLLETIRVPIIIIHDKDDDVLKYSESQKLAEMFDNITLYTTQGHGHRLKSKEVLDKVVNEA